MEEEPIEVDTEENVDVTEVGVVRREEEENQVVKTSSTQPDSSIQEEPMGSQRDLESSQEGDRARQERVWSQDHFETEDEESPVKQSAEKDNQEPEDTQQFIRNVKEFLAEIRDEKAEEAERKAQADYEDGARSRPWRRSEEQRLPEGEVTIEEAEEEQVPKASGAKKRGPKTKNKPGPKELKDNSIFHKFPGNRVSVIFIYNNAFQFISIPV